MQRAEPTLTLRQAAVAYWNVSKVARGRMQSYMTTERALAELNNILLNVDKDHPLWARAQNLKAAIIGPEKRT